MNICPACGFTNPADYFFCGKCGRGLLGRSDAVVSDGPPIAVAADASELDIVRRYMPSELLSKILAARGKVEGERRQVTMLVADLEGYTPLAEALGEEATYQLMNPIYEVMIKGIHRYEGTVQKLTGDGVLAIFGAPVALEEAPVRACQAALEIQAQMRRLGADLEVQYGRRPQLRIGIHSGPVIVGTVGTDLRMEFEVLGDTVNLAARLQSLAQPGQILLSEASHRLVEGYVESRFRGEHTVKGKADRQRLYRLEGLKPGVFRFDVSLRRGLTEFVGRRHELQVLEKCHAEARRGAVRLVDVIGEAGIGKSRVVHELRLRLETDSALFLQGRCRLEGASTPFLPFIEIVRASFGIPEGADQENVERKLRWGMERLGIDVEAKLPLLLNLLGHEVARGLLRGQDSDLIGHRTREIIRELLQRRSRLYPVVVCIEDLHWMDSTSEQLLSEVSQSVEPLPLLIICTYRPPYRPPWAGRTGVVELPLEPLSEDNTAEFLQGCLDAAEVPPELVRFIAEKAEGNPLFAEEIVRYLLDTGALQASAGGIVFSAEGSAGRVPPTVQNIIMARVDRLPEGHRPILQAASVIGRRFPLPLIHRLAGVNGRLPQYLGDMEAQGLIFCEELEHGGVYQFKHALTQESVYNGLLRPRREELHRRVAEAIEELYSDRLGEWVEVLAHQYSHTPCVEKAVYYLARAAEKSLRVYSLEEADRRFRQAIELAEAAPGSVDDTLLTDVLLGWARVHYYRMDFPGLIDMLEPRLSRLEGLHDRRRLSLLLFWLGFSNYCLARAETSKSLLDRALALGEELGDEECIGYATMGLLWLHMGQGGLFGDQRDVTDQLGERGLGIAERLGDLYLSSKCLTGLALHKMMRGRLDAARVFSMRTIELGRRASDPRATCLGLITLGWADSFEERFEESLENLEEALRLCLNPTDRLMANAARGIALALMGRAQEGLECLRQVRGVAVAQGFSAALPAVDIPYGAALALVGEVAAGVRWIEDATKRLTALGFDQAGPIGHTTLGEFYLQVVLGGAKPSWRVILRNLGFMLRTVPVASRKARHHLEEAIRTAREIDSPGFLARSLLDLGLLCKAQKRWAEARRYLEEARQIAAPLNSPLLDEKIRLALQSLPG